MVCKGICAKYRVRNRKKETESSLYYNGSKRCHVCDLLIEWPGKQCPCCGCYLRSRARNSKFKEKTLIYIE